MPAGSTRRWVLAGAWLRLAVAGLVAAGVRAGAETLRLATYNVENYTTADRLTADGYKLGYPKPETEKAALRAVIVGLQADVLALQEMGGPPYLEELRRDLRADGLDYPFARVLEAADADRHVALLARRAPRRVVAHTDLTFPYFGGREKVKRGLLEVTFATARGEVTLFIVHLKSRLTDRPDDPQSALRRAAEAVAVRDAVLSRFPDPASARFVILGDCNDVPRSRTVRSLLQRGKTEVALLLPATDSRGETWTHFYRAEESYSRIDYLLVSPGLAGAVAGGTARIYDAPETRSASDHRPVTLTLNLE